MKLVSQEVADGPHLFCLLMKYEMIDVSNNATPIQHVTNQNQACLFRLPSPCE